MKPAWPTPSRSTRPCSSPSIAVRVSGWSVMINNSPRSAPAASSATSNRPTARCISPSCTASPTPPKRQHHSPSATATPRHSTSTLITAASTSATSPPPPRMPSRVGFRPGRWARRDHARPHPRPRRRPQPKSTRPSSRQRQGRTRGAPGRWKRRQCRRCDHHPHQRPPAADVTASRLGEERRSLDRHPRQPRTVPLTVRHNRSHRTVKLPADYVRESTGLGYATTIHGAQGVSADTMHGLLTGQESRQQLYTMLTRGRHANHLYLQVVSDGDPHTVIRPETVAPRNSDRDAAADPRPRRRAHLRHHPAA